MPLYRHTIIHKFADVVHFTEYSNSYYGSEENLIVKLIKADSEDLLDYMTIQFPPVVGDAAVFSGLAVGLFWLCVLPTGTAVAGYVKEAFEQVARGGVYEVVFGDVKVSLTRRENIFTLMAQTPTTAHPMLLGV